MKLALAIVNRPCDGDVSERRVPPKAVRCWKLAKDFAVQLFDRRGAQPSKLPVTHYSNPKDRSVAYAVQI